MATDLPRRRANWKCWSRCATRCLPRFSRRPTRIPSAATPKPCAQQSARGDAAAEGGRLRGARPQAGRSATASRSASKFCVPGPGRRADLPCSTSRRWSGSASPSASAGSMTCSIRTARADFDFDMIDRRHGRQSLSPGNEQREFWGSQAADKPGSRNIGRHQEPGGRCADRAHDLRQGPRGSGRGDQGDGPRAALELLCRAAIHLRFPRYARWDRFSRAEPLPKYGRVGTSRRCGGTTPTRQPRSASAVEGIAHGATQPSARARSRHRCAERWHDFAPPPPTMAAPRCTACRCSAT